MVNLEALSSLLKLKDPGYSTVYMFSEADATKIKEAGNSRGFSQYAVGARHLVIDCDQGDAGRDRIAERLDAEGLAYEIWESGGKGYHFYIPHEFIYDIRLPYSHQQAILKLLPRDLIDLTLYQHGRLISLPGRIHPVTKKPKRLVSSHPGIPIEIPLVEEVKRVITFDATLGDHHMLAAGLQRAYDLICFPPDKGKRHIRIWGVALDLAQAGMDYEATLNLLTLVNDTWDEQKSEDEISKAVSSAYKRLEQF